MGDNLTRAACAILRAKRELSHDFREQAAAMLARQSDLLQDGVGVLQNILNGLSVDPNQDQDETWANARYKARVWLDDVNAILKEPDDA